jgi:Flp pilus assembly secretin CpaC
MIVMAVNATKSSVGPDSEGIVIGYSDGGVNTTPQPIISPNIEETIAQTTLMARSGQTVVFSGLITEEKQHVKRGAPILSDLPWIGPLFSFESDVAKRTELLIIMTPYLITDDQELSAQNQDEMDRMHWCLCDVAEVYGNTDYKGLEGTEAGIETIYPDADPSGMKGSPLYKVVSGNEAEASNRLAPMINR